ncbi:hypothetical protein NDU88_003336 [Pleurodeles waltl]|uniref:Uncharacterized protein n=1 Tax=Pleurodeles waltl TaxID=8319 RepID=A0AAV7TQS4_PLEWA|nr:hypothetical protein NDU88_003336 [Pleurodeles waltl]
MLGRPGASDLAEGTGGVPPPLAWTTHLARRDPVTPRRHIHRRLIMGKQKTGKEESAGSTLRGDMNEKNGDTEALTQHTEVILAAIQESKTALENQIATLAGEVGLLRDDHNKLKDRVKATEEMMNEATPQVKTLTQTMARMDADQKTLAMKVEDAESRSLRHNVRLVGVPEKAEGPSLELFKETWLSEVVMRGNPTTFF